jgi:4-hydroxy-3-methylbut-2-enyl diphosphate reductase
MNIHLAQHFGMCFGVRDALRLTQSLAREEPITVLGQLVHNPAVDRQLSALGAVTADLSQPGHAPTDRVVITAHGAAESIKQAWKTAGHTVTDTTCPLVRKAHRALECLVLGGYFPIVIGERNHVEVKGLVTDFPQCTVLLSDAEIDTLEERPRFGVISQTTQPYRRVEDLVRHLRERFPASEVRFVDTVCQPTKDRQTALEKLCAENDTIVVVGGRNSNNTRQLVQKAVELGTRAWHVEDADDLDPQWFNEALNIGVTAGTSTLDATVQEVIAKLQAFAEARETATPGKLD